MERAVPGYMLGMFSNRKNSWPPNTTDEVYDLSRTKGTTSRRRGNDGVFIPHMFIYLWLSPPFNVGTEVTVETRYIMRMHLTRGMF